MTDTETTIERIRGWQGSGRVHPLTCGVESCRADLDAQERGGRVVLVCLACGWVQERIPPAVLGPRPWGGP